MRQCKIGFLNYDFSHILRPKSRVSLAGTKGPVGENCPSLVEKKLDLQLEFSVRETSTKNLIPRITLYFSLFWEGGTRKRKE